MATSSFDRNVVIGKNNVKSLEKIIENQFNKTVNLSQVRTLKTVKRNELKNYISKGNSNDEWNKTIWDNRYQIGRL